jgi:ATPase/histidine kinase/DNA gyrase B/HSP90 domain protein
VDKSRARAQGGYGLGLSIAKTIASAHGGNIRAESSAEHGTSFTITLPLSE